MSKLFTRRFFLILFSIILIGFIAFWILPVSIPLILAFISALLLEPAVRMIQTNTRLKRYFAVIIVFTLFVVFIGILGYFTITKVVTEGINLVENSPAYINEINNMWDDLEQDMVAVSKDFPPEFVSEVTVQVDRFFANSKTRISEFEYIETITKIVTDIPNYLVSFLVYLIALFLFLLELPALKMRLYSFLTEKTAEKVQFMASRLSYVILGFFKAQFLVSIVIFFVSLIGLFIIQPKVALLMSFIIWIIDFIPIIGSIVILGPWSLYHLIAGDLGTGTKLAVLAVILLVIRRTVEPKVMGQQIGLSPLSTLISMYIGLKLLGIIGFIIGPLLIIAFNSAREAGLIKLNFKI
ncbi:sporulation integral membrane protein YtvI [Pseudalkalibacillus caeni]|uniref:Sporulation integral membrane protein YtvI n=1 Tax=Exobacillus caeni TaxID=2574798 RepID=A0A5R9F9Y2_9BACL|nr:sporulation integral membrane protein YtvI [Pseudalkalibacillus caeni]TLS37663.1 sporulation integral membrane protein YtvI [Pseudalkalibacillus caeni]